MPIASFEGYRLDFYLYFSYLLNAYRLFVFVFVFERTFDVYLYLYVSKSI